jgi:molybdate/tungstate transport system substrate-binding protein
VVVATVLALTSLALQDPSGPLVVFNAGSLAAPMRALFQELERRHPRVSARYESSGSIEAARKITDLGKQADVLMTADAAVMDELVLPRHAAWYAVFASNAMVIAYTARSSGAAELDEQSWRRILAGPGVRIGRADPALDPAGYRALMVFQLAERHYQSPGLVDRMLANSGAAYTRPKSVDLVALLQTGHLDYAVVYRTVALAGRLRYLELPRELDLSDSRHGDRYRKATVTVPRSRRASAGTLTFVGSPIAYAVTVPAGAPNPVAAHAFVRLLLGEPGRQVLARHGFVLPDHPPATGEVPAGLLPAPRRR